MVPVGLLGALLFFGSTCWELRGWFRGFASRWLHRAAELQPSDGSTPASRRRLIAVGLLGLFLVGAAIEEAPPAPHAPTPQLIIDTDMSFDVDDVGAVCLAHALADRGEAELVAVVYDSGYPAGIGAVSVLNEYYGRGASVALGSYKGRFGADARGEWVTGRYVPDLVRRFPSRVKDSSEVPDAVATYRRVLAAAADGSVRIAAIGFATNLAALLRSAPDEHSALSGVELVRAKVALVAWQGGWYAPLHPNGHTTFNWDCGVCCGYVADGCAGESSYAVAHMPPSVEQIFSDIGDEIYHGGALTDCAPASSPCRQAYHDFHGPSRGRNSWDPVAVLLAVRGAAAVNCSKVEAGGTNVVDRRGANTWTAGHGTKQSVLALNGERPWRRERAAASAELERLLCAPPKLKARHDT